MTTTNGISSNLPSLKNSNFNKNNEKLNLNRESIENSKTQRNVVSSEQSVLISISVSATHISSNSDNAGKNFSDVAKDARKNLDDTYKKMGKEGDIYTDWRPIFSGMDRRSLYAVASNEGGQFNALEQDMAKSAMSKQVEEAMGLNNPVNAMNPSSAAQKAGIQFLDNVSDEEKSSFDWAKQRAGLEFGYEILAQREGKSRENIESENPLVKLIKGGLNNLRRTDNPANQLEDTPEYKQAVQLAEQMKAARAQAAGIKDKDGGA